MALADPLKKWGPLIWPSVIHHMWWVIHGNKMPTRCNDDARSKSHQICGGLCSNSTVKCEFSLAQTNNFSWILW